jgi:hypothetical protein
MLSAVDIIEEVMKVKVKEQGSSQSDFVPGSIKEEHALDVLFDVETYLKTGTLCSPGRRTQYFWFKEQWEFDEDERQSLARERDLRERGFSNY